MIFNFLYTALCEDTEGVHKVRRGGCGEGEMWWVWFKVRWGA